jgi:2,3-bisphosphoglycerate-independent phosphoglycerate mutase
MNLDAEFEKLGAIETADELQFPSLQSSQSKALVAFELQHSQPEEVKMAHHLKHPGVPPVAP